MNAAEMLVNMQVVKADFHFIKEVGAFVEKIMIKISNVSTTQ